MIEKLNHKSETKLYSWLTLAILFIFSMVVGVLGYQNYFVQQSESPNLVRAIYRTFQLFTFEGGDINGKIPWELHIARFSAPLTTLIVVILAFFEIFREQWNRIKIGRLKNHVVIIGFGTKGKNVMEESLRNKEKVLVIENDLNNQNLASIKPPKSRLIIGNANTNSILNKARIDKAKSVFLLMGDDTSQINTCTRIYNMISKSDRNRGNALSCIMHLHTPEFLNTIRSHNIVKDTNDGLVLNVFNVYENSAREMFEINPPDREGITNESECFVQIVIFGFGKTGEALALQTALTGHYINGKKPKVLVVDRNANYLAIDFLKRYPDFEKFCELNTLEIEANTPQLIRLLVKEIDIKFALNTLVLCFDNKTQNLLLGLQLENLSLTKPDYPPQILIRTNSGESLNTFSEKIKPYGMSSKEWSKEVILKDNLDKKAKAIHTHYLDKRKIEKDFGTKVTDVSWEELSQEFKSSNRKAADHIGVKTRGIGCKIVDKNDPRPQADFSSEELELLSELEHRRWNAERSVTGWTLSDEKNSNTRQTPYLVDWEKLPENIKDYDREAVKNIPEVLGIVGLKVVRG